MTELGPAWKGKTRRVTTARYCDFVTIQMWSVRLIVMCFYLFTSCKYINIFNIKSLLNFLIYVHIPNLENTNNGSPMVTVAVLLHTSWYKLNTLQVYSPLCAVVTHGICTDTKHTPHRASSWHQATTCRDGKWTWECHKLVTPKWVWAQKWLPVHGVIWILTDTHIPRGGPKSHHVTTKM